MTITCRFKCDLITEYTTGYDYKFTAVFGSPENKVYWESTPSGSFQIHVLKSKGKLFEVGKEYTLDINEAR